MFGVIYNCTTVYTDGDIIQKHNADTVKQIFELYHECNITYSVNRNKENPLFMRLSA